MRVKLIVDRVPDDLESEINEFISGKKVLGIKFTESVDFWSALIVYEGDDDDG